MSLIRITAHPTQPDVVIIHAGPDLAETMGRYPEARYSRSGQYLLAATDLPGLHATATHAGAALIDERTPTTTGHRTEPHECKHCGQPGSTTNPPTYCPSCGQTWQPITPTQALNQHQPPTTRCHQCGTPHGDTWTHCPNCGTPTQATGMMAP